MNKGIFVALDREARAIFGSKEWCEHPSGIRFKKVHAGSDTFLVAVGGQGKEGVKAGFSFLVSQNVHFLINFGVSGGLLPTVQAGTLVISRQVVSHKGERISIYERPFNHTPLEIKKRGVKITDCPLLTCSQPVSSVLQKKELGKKFNCCVADMEAFHLALLCVEKNMKFLPVKAVSDSAAQQIPQAMLKCVDKWGNVSFGKLSIEIIKSPSMLIELARLGQGFNKAIKALRIAKDFILAQGQLTFPK